MTPYDYFKMFITLEIIDCEVKQTNLCSFQKNQKSINTNVSEILSMICIVIKMVLVSLPSCRQYWA